MPFCSPDNVAAPFDNCGMAVSRRPRPSLSWLRPETAAPADSRVCRTGRLSHGRVELLDALVGGVEGAIQLVESVVNLGGGVAGAVQGVGQCRTGHREVVLVEVQRQPRSQLPGHAARLLVTEVFAVSAPPSCASRDIVGIGCEFGMVGQQRTADCLAPGQIGRTLITEFPFGFCNDPVIDTRWVASCCSWGSSPVDEVVDRPDASLAPRHVIAEPRLPEAMMVAAPAVPARRPAERQGGRQLSSSAPFSESRAGFSPRCQRLRRPPDPSSGGPRRPPVTGHCRGSPPLRRC